MSNVNNKEVRPVNKSKIIIFLGKVRKNSSQGFHTDGMNSGEKEINTSAGNTSLLHQSCIFSSSI